ncbi:MAG: hypothetical protein KKF20_04630 [Bacteroidetes bacterium]|nr:hypothetical protein [Bacteroidota bacterium]
MKNFQNNINRRRFIASLSIISTAPFLKSCESFISSSEPKPIQPDIALEGSEENIASTCKEQYSTIKYLYENPGVEKTIGYYEGRRMKILRISFRKDELASYPHLRLVKNESGEAANILWGAEGLFPSIKFVDDKGNTITVGGRKMEFAIKTQSKTAKALTPFDWLILGIKIFAAALVIWIGASIAKYIAAAIAFIAFNAMVIGLLLVGLSLLIPLIQWILSITGWDMDYITNLFSKTINELANILMEIQSFILSYLG